MLIPNKLSIDFNATCQLSCPICPSSAAVGEKAAAKGYLKLSDLQQIIEANRQIDQLLIKSTGEALTNPDLLGILEYCYSKRVRMNANSGTHLNGIKDEVLEALVKYQVQTVVCSIDGATQETYGSYRIGGNLGEVLSNVRRINSYKQRYRSQYPIIIWQFIAFGHNEHEISLAKKMAEKLGMTFVVKMSWDDKFSPLHNKELAKRAMNCVAATRSEYELIRQRSYHRRCCRSLWLHPRLNWDGSVVGCDINQWGEFGGNAFKDGYVTVTNSERLDHTRRMLLGKAEPREDIPCTSCHAYSAIRKYRKPLKKSEIFASHPFWDQLSHAIYYFPFRDRLVRAFYALSGIRLLRRWKQKLIDGR